MGGEYNTTGHQDCTPKAAILRIRRSISPSTVLLERVVFVFSVFASFCLTPGVVEIVGVVDGELVSEIVTGPSLVRESCM